LVKSWASRPFISTDAAGADPKEVEIEVGNSTLERAKDENAFMIEGGPLLPATDKGERKFGWFDGAFGRGSRAASPTGSSTSDSRSVFRRPRQRL